MNKLSIEDLEKISLKLAVLDSEDNETFNIRLFMRYTIDLFKDLITDLQQFNKELRCRENLEKRVRTLEQAKTYYPMAENKHRALLNNCVDDDEVILHKREIKRGLIK